MKRTQLALTAVVALALVALAVALPASAVTDGVTNAQTQANGTPDGSFDRSIYDARTGSTVAIDVSLNNTSTATVVIGGQEKPYALHANVTDGDGDGMVELQFDTSSPESDDALGTFRDADSVTIINRTAGDGEFVGSYGMTLSYNGTRLDSAAMAVSAAETTTTTTTTTTATTTTAPMDPTETTTSDGQPGFGVVAALVAVVAAAAVVARR